MAHKKNFGCLFLLLVAVTSQAETLDGRVYSIVDGDTLMVLDGANRQREIRLFGIDAPDMQVPSKKS